MTEIPEAYWAAIDQIATVTIADLADAVTELFGHINSDDPTIAPAFARLNSGLTLLDLLNRNAQHPEDLIGALLDTHTEGLNNKGTPGVVTSHGMATAVEHITHETERVARVLIGVIDEEQPPTYHPTDHPTNPPQTP